MQKVKNLKELIQTWHTIDNLKQEFMKIMKKKKHKKQCDECQVNIQIDLTSYQLREMS